jgi:hypothetical protein
MKNEKLKFETKSLILYLFTSIAQSNESPFLILNFES